MTTTTKQSKLTISSRYFDGTITTRSRDAEYVRRLMNKLRRGDRDWIQIHDEDGNQWDVSDQGRGLELFPF